MPIHHTSRFGLSNGWLRGEDFWGDPVSANFTLSDMLLHPCVKSMTLNAPPHDNSLGDMYIVPIGGTLQFTGRDNNLAIYTENGWVFLMPVRGVRVRCDNPDDWFWWTGATDGWKNEDWIPGGPPILGTRFDIVVSVGFEPLPGDYLCAASVPEPMTLRANGVGCVGRTIDWPGAEVVLSIHRGTTAVGTITFTPGQLVPTFAIPSDVMFGAADLLCLVCPDEIPEGFKNFGITMRLILNSGG